METNKDRSEREVRMRRNLEDAEQILNTGYEFKMS